MLLDQPQNLANLLENIFEIHVRKIKLTELTRI